MTSHELAKWLLEQPDTPVYKDSISHGLLPASFRIIDMQKFDGYLGKTPIYKTEKILLVD